MIKRPVHTSHWLLLLFFGSFLIRLVAGLYVDQMISGPCGYATNLIVYRTVLEYFDDRTARLASMTAVIYPHFVTRAGNIRDNVFLPLQSLVLLYTIQQAKTPSLQNPGYSGLSGMELMT